MSGIKRFLPNNEYEATRNSPTQATGANPFVTVADLPAASGNGIYDGTGTIPTATVSIVTDTFGIELTDVTDKFWIGENGFTPIASIHFHARGTGGTYIEGFNSSDGNSALRVWNSGRTIKIADFENNGDVVLSPTAGSVSLGIGTAVAKLTVRGLGSGVGTRGLHVEGQSGQDHMMMQDDGQFSTGSGTAAIHSGTFGQTHRTSGYTTGIAFFPTNATTAGVRISPSGTTSTGLLISHNTSATSINRAASFDNKTSTAATNVASYHFSRNGSTYTIAGDFLAGGGDGVPSIGYLTAIRAAAASALNNLQFGIRSTAQYNNIATVYTKDVIAVYGEGKKTAGHASSTSAAIGAKFLTSGTAGSGLNMAINVPSTGNNGNVVIGADASSANARTIEVTGEMEFFGNGNGMYMRSPNGTVFHLTVTNAGAWDIA